MNYKQFLICAVWEGIETPLRLHMWHRNEENLYQKFLPQSWISIQRIKNCCQFLSSHNILPETFRLFLSQQSNLLIVKEKSWKWLIIHGKLITESLTTPVINWVIEPELLFSEQFSWLLLISSGRREEKGEGIESQCIIW